MKTLKKLQADEHAAVRDYGAKAAALDKKGDQAGAKKIRHIQKEEKHHAAELGVLIRKRGQHTAAQHPAVEGEE